MERIKCNIIICGPAVGKTYLSKIDDRFVDVDGMKADYKYGLYNVSSEEKEKGKLNRGPTINNDSSKYAINLLIRVIAENKIALLSYNQKVIDYIINNKIEYCLVYADKDSREEYKIRMERRGNQTNFVDQMTNETSWEQFYIENENDSNAKYKVKLKKGEYLSDIKDYFI